MSIQKYEENNLLFNSNFTEAVGDQVAYRGELVLVEGEVADAQGRCKPPISLLLGAVLLEENEKLIMTIGLLPDLSELETFFAKYKEDFAEGMLSMIFVRNIKEPMTITEDGFNIWALPLSEGIPWNEAIEELALEKSDFKGQSAGTKLVTLYDELKTYKCKGETLTLAEALDQTVEVKMTARGPV